MKQENSSSKPRLSRAAVLLAKVVAAGKFDAATLAAALVVPEATLAAFAAGKAEMSLERQACLAQFLIENEPSLRREGHSLLGQVQAAGAFAESQGLRAPSSSGKSTPPPRPTE
jgi:hypothetical protein